MNEMHYVNIWNYSWALLLSAIHLLLRAIVETRAVLEYLVFEYEFDSCV